MNSRGQSSYVGILVAQLAFCSISILAGTDKGMLCVMDHHT